MSINESLSMHSIIISNSPYNISPSILSNLFMYFMINVTRSVNEFILDFIIVVTAKIYSILTPSSSNK